MGLTLQSSECFDSGNPIYDQSLTVKTVLKSGDLLEAALERRNVKITSSKPGGTSTTWIPRPHPNLVGVCIVLVFVIGFLSTKTVGLWCCLNSIVIGQRIQEELTWSVFVAP